MKTILALALIASGAFAQSNIVRLGGTRLSQISDADTIEVNTCTDGEVGRISSLKIFDDAHEAHIEGLRVTYGNLTSEDIRVDAIIRPGESTDWVDVLGADRGRCVKSVRVFGHSRQVFHKSDISVYGLRADEPTAPDHP